MDGWRLALRLVDAEDTEAGERAEAIARIKRRRRFMSSLATYAIVNAALWLVWALTGHDTSGFPWPAWVTLIWGFFLAMHALRTFGYRRRPISEADIQREMMRGRSSS
jgi:fatty acid desaturase